MISLQLFFLSRLSAGLLFWRPRVWWWRILCCLFCVLRIWWKSENWKPSYCSEPKRFLYYLLPIQQYCFLTWKINLKYFVFFKHFLVQNLIPDFIFQSTLVISKSNGSSDSLQDIRTSTYQMCKNEENTNRTTKFHKWTCTCNLTPIVSNIYWNIGGKGRNFSSYPQYFVTCC